MKIDKRFANYLLYVLFLIVAAASAGVAQTTGKIAGKVTDATTKEPLPGVNVLIDGTTMGAATDADGQYYIINIPPGNYSVRIKMVGYETTIVKDVIVSVNRTTTVDAKLKETVIQGQEVVVTANKISTKKDQTGSIRNVSAEQMETLPVENLDGVVNMQAGVVQGHFRGGRLDEVSYMVDGLQVNESFNKTGRAINLETDVIKEVEVITGTFNAEYGNAMSGVVNAVTKDGTNTFHGAASANEGNYYTSHNNIFAGLKPGDVARNQDYRLFLSGPVIKDYLTFVANVRLQNNKNYLNGIYRFNVNDYSDFSSYNPKDWYSEHTGDGSYVSMNSDISNSYFAKLSFKPSNSIRTSLTYTLNYQEAKSYNHTFKYDPYGIAPFHRQSHMLDFQLNHTLSQSLFYEFKASYMHDKNGTYIYDNPTDPNYVHDIYLNNNGPDFYTGGQSKTHQQRILDDYNLKLDLTWQATNNHIFKSGLLFIQHSIDNNDVEIRNKYYGDPLASDYYVDSTTNKRVFPYYQPIVMPDSSIFSDIYKVKPLQFAYYIQDKMEFENLVVNLGLRFDYFDPNVDYPSNWRNPGNQLRFPENPEKMSTYPKAPASSQLSPRLGISYQLGSTAVLRFAYGHFFQMPPLYALYANHSYLVSPNNFQTMMGNPLLKPQKTVQYEVGLWQELTPTMGLEVAIFYRDIYELLGTKILTTYNQVKYGLYSNLDYGNARGLELKYDFRSGPLSVYLNYTLQFTKGNSDNPTFAFTRAGASMDPVNRLIRMSWDQRHTLNVTIGYNQKDFGATLTGYFNSGTPYTWTPLSDSRLARVNLFPNNSPKPSQISVDLQAYYDVWHIDNYKIRASLLVFNLLDQLNAVSVYDQTGKAYTDIIRESDLNSLRSNFNTYEDVIHNPSMYAAPRYIKFGLDFIF